MYTLKTMEFFLRFAPKIIILVDAQAILFLRLSRESSGILLRFSIEFSRYDVEIHHVKGEDNKISDVLSHQHIDLDKIIENGQRCKANDRKAICQTFKSFKNTGWHSFQSRRRSFYVGHTQFT